jgi:fucose permease
LKKLKFEFWVLAFICSLNLGLYIPFCDGLNGMVQKRFNYTEEQAGQLVFIVYLSAVILSVPAGLAVDKIGYRRYTMIFGSGIFLLVQWLLYFAD